MQLNKDKGVVVLKNIFKVGIVTATLMLSYSGCTKKHDSKALDKVFEDTSVNAVEKLRIKEGEVKIGKLFISLEQKKKLSTILEELSDIDKKIYYYQGQDIEIGGIRNLKVDSFESFNRVLKSITNYELEITKNKLFADLPKVVELKEVKQSTVLDEIQVGQNSLVLPSKLLSSISNYANGWKIDYRNNVKDSINDSDIIDFKGSAREFINFYAKVNDLFVDWDYSQKTITFSKYKQKILRLQTPNEKYKFKNTIDISLNNNSNSSESSSSSSSSGSGSSGVELTASYDIIENFKKVITTIIPQNSENEYINIIEDTGHIAVSTTPQKMLQIEDMVKQLNKDAFKQVYIKTTLIETDLSNQFQNGINWSYVKDSINSVTNTGSALVAGVNSQVASLDTTLGTGSFLKYRSNIKDIGAIVKLLNTFGDTAVSFQGSGVTTNNIPIIYNLSNTQGYISEFKIEGVGDNIVVAPTQDSVTGGTYLYIKPSLKDDTITLSLQAVTSRINPFIRQDFQNGQYVQSKDIVQKNFSQNVNLKSGEKIIIGGIVQKSIQSSYEGLSPDQNFVGSSLLGVKDKAHSSKEIAIMIEVEEI
jgi:type II secretory pathway component GspD/PulD (secretin)